MFEHHKYTIEKVAAKLKNNEKILSVILGGSVAHGFASENSDIDLMLVLSESDYKRALENGDLHYSDTESADYKDGYVEGKYISQSFIEAVAEKGSEPARFAFKDAVILYSNCDNINSLIVTAATYPRKSKYDNMEKFYAQFEGWNWMYYEGLKRNDSYVINHSVTNLCLFGGRLLLAYNELLYPYHKWFLRVLESAENKPHNIIDLINSALLTKNENDVKALYSAVKYFYKWPEYKNGWVARFVIDSEINWMNGAVPIGDL